MFHWGALIHQAETFGALALGYGSLYNHADQANLRYHGDAQGQVLRFIARTAIAPNAELTIDYKGNGVIRESNGWPASPLIRPPGVYIKDTCTRAGRGVFAMRGFSAGEVIERAPAVPCQGPRLRLDIRRHLFAWDLLTGRTDTPAALVLGYGSLYSHHDRASVRYEGYAEGRALTLIADRDIIADEELTINYNAHGGGVILPNREWLRMLDSKQESLHFRGGTDRYL